MILSVFNIMLFFSQIIDLYLNIISLQCSHSNSSAISALIRVVNFLYLYALISQKLHRLHLEHNVFCVQTFKNCSNNRCRYPN